MNQRTKLTEAEYNSEDISVDNLDEFVMLIYKGEYSALRQKCILGYTRFWSKDNALTATDLTLTEDRNIEPFSRVIPGYSVSVANRLSVDGQTQLQASTIPSSIIENYLPSTQRAEVIVDYCWNKCRENEDCVGILIDEQDTSVDGYVGGL